MSRKQKKVAVVMYGFLRTYKQVADSLLKHVIDINDADLFIFAPDKTGVINDTWYAENVKKSGVDSEYGDIASERDIKNVYRNKVTDVKLWRYDPKVIKQKNIESIPIVASIQPERICSMFFHIQKAFNLMLDYEKANKFKYDTIILLRPDLAFYSDINTKTLDCSVINGCSGNGILDRKTGKFMRSNAPVFYWKNVVLGQCMEADTYRFNDFVLVSNRENMKPLFTVYDDLQYFIKIGLPFNPETIIYWLLCYNKNVKYVSTNDWCVEIFRNNYKEIEGIYDLDNFSQYKEKQHEEIMISKNFNKKRFKNIYLLYLFVKYGRNKEKLKHKLEKYDFI